MVADNDPGAELEFDHEAPGSWRTLGVQAHEGYSVWDHQPCWSSDRAVSRFVYSVEIGSS